MQHAIERRLDHHDRAESSRANAALGFTPVLIEITANYTGDPCVLLFEMPPVHNILLQAHSALGQVHQAGQAMTGLMTALTGLVMAMTEFMTARSRTARDITASADDAEFLIRHLQLPRARLWSKRSSTA